LALWKGKLRVSPHIYNTPQQIQDLIGILIAMTTSKYIFKKKSGVHGMGHFCSMDIPQGTRIIEYVGEKITKPEAERRGPKLIEYAYRIKN